ncbi:MAG: 23S rRNA (adenine(2503)-C(2))-methyltransferase RlmN [Firmicutes bacterium]|nr:23S rRNA (adenine(2503)-C(2))-methyltransferase RlmN [Bacillota bacterium]
MKDFKDLTREERRAALKALGQQSFREGQIFEWICRGARSFDEMSNLSKELRASLSESYTLGSLSVEVEQISSDGTRKYLLGLPDGNSVEAVLMRYEYGNSLCISTQVGCRMGCSFCASTIGGKLRDLKAWEMLDEFLVCQEHSGLKLNHLVLMGIGEPFDNYANLCEFLRQIHDPKGPGLSYRNITVSTCGLIPGIADFARDFPQVNLAVSLHASDQEEREKLMPVAKAYRLPELMEACRSYTEATGRRISFEYTLIAGKNDSEEDAARLARLLRGMLCHVNLIRLNPVRETGLRSAEQGKAQAFRDYLESHGVPASIRRTLGQDIDAACGQLRKKKGQGS